MNQSQPPTTLERLIESWDGETVIVRRHRETGTWILVAIHSSVLGPAGGGTRMKSYPDVATALLDAFRLAEGMTSKFALAGLAMGGAKAVLAVPGPLDTAARRGVLHAYGDLVGELRGMFQTGPDIGTSSEDMDVVAERGAPFVFARTEAAGGAGNSARPTALGVFCGLQATVEQVFGTVELEKRRIAVQGIGGVGGLLTERLLEAGAHVICSDVDATALERLRDRFAASGRLEIVQPESIYDVECDVFSPNAIGGVLDAGTIPRLRCRAVAGGANNQLAGDEDAERLRLAGILYAPDYVINSGGALGTVGREALGWTDDQAERRVLAIGDTLRSIYRQAEIDDTDTETAARRRVEEILEARRTSTAGEVSGSAT